MVQCTKIGGFSTLGHHVSMAAIELSQGRLSILHPEYFYITLASPGRLYQQTSHFSMFLSAFPARCPMGRQLPTGRPGRHHAQLTLREATLHTEEAICLCLFDLLGIARLQKLLTFHKSLKKFTPPTGREPRSERSRGDVATD